MLGNGKGGMAAVYDQIARLFGVILLMPAARSLVKGHRTDHVDKV